MYDRMVTRVETIDREMSKFYLNKFTPDVGIESMLFVDITI